MADTIFSHVRLDAVYTAVPRKELRIEDELPYYGNSLKKVERARRMLGTDKRRIAYPDLIASDLCQIAAERLLAEQNVDRTSLDALIFLSQFPDFDLPATACRLQHELGLSKHCAAFDVNQGCAGFVYGLWLASSLIAAGGCRKVLLLTGDSCARDTRNRIMAPIFGDGASAALVCRDENASEMRFSLGTDGTGFRHIIIPGGRAMLPYSRTFEDNRPFFEDVEDALGNPWRLNEVFMNGGEIFNFVMTTVVDHLKNFMQQAHVLPEDVDWLFLHQANKQIIETLAAQVGMPVEKTPSSAFSKYGNLSSSSIPSAMCEHFGGTSVTRQKLLLCGYGVGFSWASCLLEADNLKCAPVISIAPDDVPAKWTLEQWSDLLRGREDI
ncbi:ketoacyl-ACP synthase III [Desulfovibrio sp.]|uniref:ketoacyl-ACP synthase III n=1 Tax=Desulfovibrio sp. TaxID=885 RepID=UPI0025BC87EF|nr:ketoacyl-ACP synthase III [Desulfovibrio sp.]MCI7569540.1 ketoacyl-ACP synthase III [Desulfovibrio sp.]